MQPVREQQEVMLQQDNMLVNQTMIQHNIPQQDNTAYNRRPYDQLQKLIFEINPWITMGLEAVRVIEPELPECTCLIAN